MRWIAVFFLLLTSSLFGQQRLTDAAVANKSLAELRLMRGEIFGRHGGIFSADRDIDEYLRKQSWYKPNRDFTNDELTAPERANLDVIRHAEATKHAHVEPGDMRWWQSQVMTEAQLGEHSGAELRVLLAEIEAIHGKRFDDLPTLQTYFDVRYWYVPDLDYAPKRLSVMERRNLTVIESAMRKQRKVVLLPGDMGTYMDKPVTREMLDGLWLHELRLLRNEIYARHGRVFQDAGLHRYFSGLSWYKPNPAYDEASLTGIERANAETIRLAEKGAGSLHFEG